MWWYIGRRLLQTIPVILGATLLIYALVFLRPGDPVLGLFGDKPVSDAVKAQIEAQYHLDKPFLVQWLYFLKGVVTLDLGTSFDGQSVISQIRDTFPVTVTLALMALAFELVFGIVLGTIAGLRRNGFFDSSLLVLSLVVLSVPIFVVGFVFQLVIGVKLGWAPPTVGGDWSAGKLILPAVVLGIVDLAFVLRLTRTSVAESMGADFVRTARAKGLPEGQVVVRHVLRNSLIPVVTYLGVNLGALMAGAIITEGIFNVPGIGNLAYRSINKGDNPTVVAIVTLIVLVYVIMSLLIDLLYAVLDPRIRYA
ncbi:ABC transporter permease [Aeromicrobium sp.]|uniref:ABC transporter permease n=1 Tax=Aeromicrobium sp. TaxID=1871063 RepID=UPI0019BC5D15|nr:ABC transporter permease [Aeromicrobium sp.]MBC7633512.1 ABC transporter permease [Aeromicrobium sp.]